MQEQSRVCLVAVLRGPALAAVSDTAELEAYVPLALSGGSLHPLHSMRLACSSCQDWCAAGAQWWR